MKGKWKLLLALLLAAVMLFGLLPASALAATDSGHTITIEHNLSDIAFLNDNTTKTGDFTQLSGLTGTFIVYSDTSQSRYLIKNYTSTIQNSHILRSIEVASNGEKVVFDIPNPFKTTAISDFSALGISGTALKVQTAVSGNGQIVITLTNLQLSADVTISFLWKTDDDPNYTVTATGSDEHGTAAAEFSKNIANGGSDYKLTATPNPNWAFDHWEYRSSADGTTWDDGGWAAYTGLTAASGTVTVDAHTQFRAHFIPAQFFLHDEYLLYWTSIIRTGKEMLMGRIAQGGEKGRLSYQGDGILGWFAIDPDSLSPAVPGEPCCFEFRWNMTGPIGWKDQQGNAILTGRLRVYAGTDTSAEPVFDSGEIYVTDTISNSQVLTPRGSTSKLEFIMPKAEYLTLVFEIDGFETMTKTYPTGLNFALEDALKALDGELNTLDNLRWRYFIDKTLKEASQSAFEGMTESDIDAIVAAARAKIEGYIDGSNKDYIEVCFNDTMVFTETGIPQSEAFQAAMEQVYPREKGFWYFDAATTQFGYWVNGFGGRAFTASELGPDGIAHTEDDGVLETAIRTPSKTFAAGEPLPTSGVVTGAQSGGLQYYVNGKYADFGVTGWNISDNEIFTWGPSDGHALYDPLYSLAHIKNTGTGYIVGDDSDETALLWAVAYLHRIGVSKEQVLTAIGKTEDETGGMTAKELYEALLAAYPQYAERLSRETATDMDKIPSVVAAYDAINAIDEAATEDARIAAVEAARAAYNAINLKGQTGLKKSFLQGYFGAQEPYKTAYLKLLAAEQEMGIEPPALADPADALAGVLAYLKANVADPVYGSVGGEWAVLAMARGGVMTEAIQGAYLANLDAAIAGNKISKYTDYERVTLALSSLGIDASAYGETPVDLTAAYKTFTPMDDRSFANMTLMADIYGLIALNAMPYTGQQDSYVNALCTAALPGGGWNFTPGDTAADTDTTAMAIQALAPYYSTNATVKNKVDAALNWLKTKQDTETGAFKNFVGTASASTTAQVVTALCALGINPAGQDWTVGEDMNPLKGLLTYYNAESGAFGETDTAANLMSSEQAAYALVAWDRMNKSKNALYDMSDAFSGQGPGTEYGLYPDEIAGYVTISVEDQGVRKDTELSRIEAQYREPLGTIIPATRVPFKENDTIAAVTLRLLDEMGITATHDGTAFSGFYMRYIGNFTVNGTFYDSFGEFDAGQGSGWMVTWNDWFIDQGASAFQVEDGDVIRWQYTCQKGKDIGDPFYADEEAAQAVEEQIAAIGEVTLNSESAINAARQAYNSLTDAQKALVDNLSTLEAAEARLAELQQQAADEEAAQAVEEQIAAIGEVTLNSESAINAARQAYEDLTGAQKALVDNLSTLEAAEARLAELQQQAADEAAAQAVEEQIAAIGEVTLNSAGPIQAARQAYENLTGAQKALVDNLSTLEAAEARLAELQQQAADEAAAQAVEEQIAAIGEVTLNSAGPIQAARQAYEDLTDTQKALVDNLSTLEAAEAAYQELVEAAEQAEQDAAAAAGVDEMIDAIGDVTLNSENAIQAARRAYNALTPQQKALVENLDELEAAETRLAELKQQAADEQAAQAVEDQIASIGRVTLNSENAINAARRAYNALTPQQKALVENLDVLEAAEARLAELKQQAADEQAAQAVEDQIASIGRVTLNSENAINAARRAYNALTPQQKALVENLDVLEAAEERLAELKQQAADEQAAADKAAAKAVDDQIASIGRVTLNSERAIQAARRAYNALTPQQKALVENLDVL